MAGRLVDAEKAGVCRSSSRQPLVVRCRVVARGVLPHCTLAINAALFLARAPCPKTATHFLRRTSWHPALLVSVAPSVAQCQPALFSCAFGCPVPTGVLFLRLRLPARCLPASGRTNRRRRCALRSVLGTSIEGVDEDFAEAGAAIEGVFGQAAKAPVASYADHVFAGEQECFAERSVNQAMLPKIR